MDNNSRSDERMIIMQLTRTNVFTRWPCHICGGETEKLRRSARAMPMALY
jgi:hypothetical protein